MPAPEDLRLLIETVEAAGDIALRHFRRGVRSWDKDDNLGPVTEADLEVDAYLSRILRKARPRHGWLSEESGTTTDRIGMDDVWVIDPIDGTRAFMEHSRDWAISAALVTDGIPQIGVVYMPAKERMYVAHKGAGATRDGNPIRVKDSATLEQATILTTKPNLDPRYWKGEVPKFERAFRSSLAYRLCLVAEGQYDAMLTLRPTWEWDVAAGLLIVEEAGGTGLDGNGAQPRFNNLHPQIAGTAAGGAVLSDLMVRRAAPVDLPGAFTPEA